MRVGIVLVTALLVGAVPARSAESPEDAAARAREAHAAGTGEALTAIANAPDPDPWIVVEALLRAGDVDAATALAATRRSFDREALEAYVKWRAESPVRPDVTEAVREARRVVDLAEYLGRIERLLAGGRGVSHVLLMESRAGAINGLGRGDGAVGEALIEAASAAEAIGWHKRVFQSHRAAFSRLFRGKNAKRLEEIARTLLALAEKSGDKTEAWDAHGCAANALQRVRRTEEALQHARRSFELSETTLQARNAMRVVIVMNIRLGNEHEILRELRNLKKLDQKLGDRFGEMIADTQIARYEARLGHSARAMARIEGVLEFMKKHGKHTNVMGTHMQAATISRHLHDPERALEHIRLARAAAARARAAREPYPLDPLGIDKSEAYTLALLGRYKDSAALHRKVLDGRKGSTKSAKVNDLAALAIILAYLGEHEEAGALFDQAEALLGPELESHIHARLYSVRASALVLAGKFDDALRSAEKAERISKDAFMTEFRAGSFGVMGRVWYERGEMKRSVAAFDEMLRLLLERSAMLPDRTGATFRSNFATSKRHLSVEYAIEAAARTGDAGTLFRVAERINAVALRSRLGRTDVAESLAPELREQEAALQEAETQAVRRFRRAQGEARGPALEALGAVREKLNRHRERMRAEQAAAAQIIDPALDDLRGTQKRLAEDEALVLYAEGKEHVWALVADRENARITKVGGRTKIANLLDTLVLEDPGFDWKADVAKLRAVLVEPLKLAKETRRLAVVPAGALVFVPFATVLDQEVTLLPSVTTGRLLGAQAVGGKGVLAVGDPESADGRRLPGARKEAEAIGDVVLVGRAATEAGIEAALKKRERWRAIHLACHGLIDPFHPLRSALSLTPGDDDDGLWTVSELLRTRIAADLAVLGSCSTGRGKSFDREGVLGFVHAFFVAGARQVIVSLWNVDDEATSALLRQFHKEWGAGVAPAAALRRAQDWLRKQPKWAHPAYWAAWQLWGPR